MLQEKKKSKVLQVRLILARCKGISANPKMKPSVSSAEGCAEGDCHSPEQGVSVQELEDGDRYF